MDVPLFWEVEVVAFVDIASTVVVLTWGPEDSLRLLFSCCNRSRALVLFASWPG